MEIYKKLTTNDVKKLICKSYSGDLQNNMERELKVDRLICNYGEMGYVTMCLDGSPPKGIAIWQPDHKFLIIIDAWGKCSIKRDVILEGSGF